MFRTVVGATSLTTPAANDFFNNIVAENTFNGDVSFLATLRALMANRMPNNERLSLRFTKSSFNAEVVGSTNTRRMVESICQDWYVPDSNYIAVHNLCNPQQESNLACFELLRTKFTDVFEGWHRLEDVTTLFRKTFNVLCFINPELKSAILFVDDLNLRKLHFLQSAILGVLPWYFDREAGITEIERELLVSCREKTADAYLSCIERIAGQFDFETAGIRKMLRGFETAYERRELEKAKANVSNCINQINALNAKIGEYMRSMNDQNIRIMGLETKIAGGGEDSEIMEYFLCNRRLVLEKVENDQMYFAVRDYLSYYDEEIVKRYIEAPNSCVYNHHGNRHITDDQIRKLMTAVFIDETIRIRICAAYRFDLNGHVSTRSNHNFGPEFRDYMPNPHINRWNCMGSYTEKINSLLMDRNYIAALEQAVASAKSLNWADGTVMGTFFGTVYGSETYNNKAFELPDGRVVRPEEAIAWLEEQEAQTAPDAGNEEEVNDE